ncbi:MAG: acyl--CoA ligase [Deltaproteobacteria bacterium]|nr:acyl--CoA ligase [Deltaproteobacteria bacterium]
MNIYNVLQRIAADSPNRLFVSVENDAITYERFASITQQMSAALMAAGIHPKEPIVLIVSNSSKWLTLFWAIVRTGAIPVPVDPNAGEWELERLFTITGARLCFASRAYRSNFILQHLQTLQKRGLSLQHIIPIEDISEDDGMIDLQHFAKDAKNHCPVRPFDADPSDTLMLACTSGSTGNPKIIEVPHVGFYQSQKDMGTYLGFCATDVMLLGMPLYHQGGFGMGLQMLLKGGSIMYQTLFDPVQYLQTIQEKKVTVVQLTATLAKILLSHPHFDSYNLSSVKLVYFAGEMLPMDIAEQFFKTRHIRVVNVIGSSETATMVVWDSERDGDVDVNEFRPLSFTRVKILDNAMNDVPPDEVGTIYISTDALITGYYQNDAETQRTLTKMEGRRWFNTGDLARRTTSGRIRFVGRARRIIKRGATLIYPEEVESFLLTHPAIEAVAVIGESHELIGETTVALIQTKKGHQLTRSDIVHFCIGKLSTCKIPDRVLPMEEIPKYIGKVQFKHIKMQTQ